MNEKDHTIDGGYRDLEISTKSASLLNNDQVDITQNDSPEAELSAVEQGDTIPSTMETGTKDCEGIAMENGGENQVFNVKKGVKIDSPTEMTVGQPDRSPSSPYPQTRRQDEQGDFLTVSFPPIAREPTSGSTRPYSAFPSGTRWFLVTMAGISAVFSPISSNIFVPAIPTLSMAFNKSEADISLAVTVYLIFQAITPSLFGSLSDTYGRRPVYILVLTIYLGANVGLALCPTSAYWLLLVLRALQATGGSAVIAIGSGTVADVSEPRERGKFMAVFQAASMFGPAFGPMLGGILGETLGWRSIFWFLTISTGVVLVPLIFFMPETLRSLVGDGSIEPPPLSMSPSMLWHRRQMKRELAKSGGESEPVIRPPTKKFEPLSAFMILLHAEIILTFIFTSLLYLEFYCILTVYSTALKNSYGLSELKIGLCYLPAGVGSIFAVLLSGRYQDYLYRKEMDRVGGDYRKQPETFRLELTRLKCIFPFMVCFLIGSTALGWCLDARAPLAVTLIFNFTVGLGTGTNGTATIYGQDIFPGKGGAVSASLNLVRCLFGAVGTAVIQYMYQSALGAGWTFVVLSGICVLAFPLLISVVRHGKQWRDDREAKKKTKKNRKQSMHGLGR